MEEQTILSAFFCKASKDNRISIGHLGLYATLFVLWKEQGYPNPFCIYSHEVKPKAKISSSATYHKLIKQLDEYGYIRYEPSFYKGTKSRFFLNGGR